MKKILMSFILVAANCSQKENQSEESKDGSLPAISSSNTPVSPKTSSPMEETGWKWKLPSWNDLPSRTDSEPKNHSSDSVPEVKKEPSLKDKILETSTLQEALTISLPFMEDEQVDGSMASGNAALALWASTKLRWEMLIPHKSETTHALIMKNSEKERGKILCIAGSLIEIEGETKKSPLSIGLMFDNSMKLYSFINAGSSGELTANSNAKMCGIVVGQFHYKNSGGGTGHAAQIIGMFDLPENKKN